MRTPVNGVHTSGSQYPRTELREVNPDGSNAAWNPSDGRTRTFDGIYKVNHLPAGTARRRRSRSTTATPRSPPSASRTPAGRCRLSSARMGTPHPALDAPYTYGRSLDVQVVVNRRVLVYFNGTKRFGYPFTDLNGTGRSVYLKAGDYLQANTSTVSASDYGDVSCGAVERCLLKRPTDSYSLPRKEVFVWPPTYVLVRWPTCAGVHSLGSCRLEQD